MAAFWDAMISVYWSTKPRELHLMTKDCKSVVFARFHPEEKVPSSQHTLAKFLHELVTEDSLMRACMWSVQISGLRNASFQR